MYESLACRSSGKLLNSLKAHLMFASGYIVCAHKHVSRFLFLK